LRSSTSIRDGGQRREWDWQRRLAELDREGVVGLFTKYFNFTRNEVRYILADGEDAIARLDVSGTTHTSGKPIAFSATECFVVRNGRITEIQPYHFDTAYVIEALSVD
jgi:ketosteroid isomerase-like protein